MDPTPKDVKLLSHKVSSICFSERSEARLRVLDEEKKERLRGEK
jgi:hypothetical protein